MFPEFLIAGSAKAGSSTLYHYLSEHPDIFMPSEKEPAFFTKNWECGPDWYQSLFEPKDGERVAGEATVEYMVDPAAPRRIYQTLPEVKLIFILRNPIDRAWSHYWHRVKNGEETRSFEQIMDGRALSSEYPVRYGMYYRQLQRYFDLFKSDQIKIIILERAKQSFPDTLKRIYLFIGVDPTYLPTVVEPKNKSAMCRSALLARFSAKIRSAESYKRQLPTPVLRPLKSMFRYVNKKNMQEWEYPVMSKLHKEILKDLFYEDMKALEKFCPGVLKTWECK